jgi:hypothetical protein
VTTTSPSSVRRVPRGRQALTSARGRAPHGVQVRHTPHSLIVRVDVLR